MSADNMEYNSTELNATKEKVKGLRKEGEGDGGGEESGQEKAQAKEQKAQEDSPPPEDS